MSKKAPATKSPAPPGAPSAKGQPSHEVPAPEGQPAATISASEPEGPGLGEAEPKPQRFSKKGKPVPENAIMTPTGGFIVPGGGGKPGKKEKRRRMIREVFEEVLEYDLDGCTQLAAGFIPPHWPYDGPPSMAYIFAAQQILSAGTKGSPTEIYNRLEGPVTQKTEISGPGGSPVVLQTYLPLPAAAMKKPEDPPTGD